MAAEAGTDTALLGAGKGRGVEGGGGGGFFHLMRWLGEADACEEFLSHSDGGQAVIVWICLG